MKTLSHNLQFRHTDCQRVEGIKSRRHHAESYRIIPIVAQSPSNTHPVGRSGCALSTLEDISRLILQSHDLSQTLANIVELVANRMATEVCSIYLLEQDSDDQGVASEGAEQLVLRATEGLSKESIGRVRLSVGEGLIGLTAERLEVVNVPSPEEHPKFRYFEEADESRYHSFLGLPLYDRREMMGVMAIQTIQRRDFNDNEISTLTTIALQLSSVIANARLLDAVRREPPTIEDWTDRDATGRAFQPVLRGKSITSGVVAAPAHVIDESLGLTEVVDSSEPRVAADESARLADAIESARIETLCMEKRVADRLTESDAAIFHSHLMVLEDQAFLSKLEDQITAGHSAIQAVKSVVTHYTDVFRRMEDPYLRQRGLDIEDIGRRVLAILSGITPDRSRLSSPGIIVAKELMASDLVSMDFDMIRGIVLESESSNSHAVIVAKSLGIPVLVNVAGALAQTEPGTPLILDGNLGCLFVEPDADVRQEYQQRLSDDQNERQRLAVFKDREAITRDGHAICLRANIGMLSDVISAREKGAEGVGLYRTEIPFMERASFPDRETQYGLYRHVVESFEGQVVTFRTLDIGADKSLPYASLPREENPALGWRSVRVSLDKPEPFRTQIEAILMASRHGKARVMFPMISTVDDLRACRRMVAEAHRNLREEGITVPEIPLGVMIEVPAAVAIARHLARESDFFSLGTNDLIQYLLAADRGNALVDRYYDPYHPAVLRVIEQLVRTCDAEDQPLCICGEMAGESDLFALLVGLGLREFSVSSPAILKLKGMLAEVDLADLKRLSDEALQLGQSDEIRRLVDVFIRNQRQGSASAPYISEVASEM